MLNLTQQQSAAFARNSLKVARLPLMTRLLGKAMALCYRLIGKDRYDDFRLERVLGMPFVVTPSVFNPKVLRTGEFLASQIDSRLLQRDWEVLDMGTGSGVCAVFAARHVRRVVAVDINPAAVDMVNRGELPFAEPGAADVLSRALEGGRIQATADSAAVSDAESVVPLVGGLRARFCENPLGTVPSGERF